MLTAHITLGVLALQFTETQGTWLTVSVVVIAVCMALITLGLVISGIALLVMKARITAKVQHEFRKAQPAIASARAKIEPIVANTGAIVQDLKPKIRSVSEDLAELTHMVRAQATDLDSTLSDVTLKARSQVDRVNGMVNSTLDTTTEVVSSIERGIRVPFREVSGILAGVKAGLEVLVSGSGSKPGGSSTVSRHVTRTVERAAREAQAGAELRAREGREAEMRLRSADLDSARSVVEAEQRPI